MKVEKMRQQRKKPTAIFMEFVGLVKKYKSDLFCFFEGEDDIKYYSIRIKNITGLNSENIHYSSCDGKSVICEDGKFGVLEVYRIITAHKEYQKTKLAFFIDRDFDPTFRTLNCHNGLLRKLIHEKGVRNYIYLKKRDLG